MRTIRSGGYLTLWLVTAFCAACQGSGDRLAVPTPSAAQFVAMELTCMHATSNEFVVVGGYLTRADGGVEAMLLRSQNSGQKWIRVGSETENLANLFIQAVHFNDARRGWIGGIRVVDTQMLPVVLRTDDGGGHWRESILPQDRATVVTHVAELRFTTDEDATVQVHFADPAGEKPLVNVFETRDEGRNWIIKEFTDAAAVSTTDPAEVFVSPDQGFRLEAPLGNGTQILLYTASRGVNWVPRAQFHVSQLPLYY